MVRKKAKKLTENTFQTSIVYLYGIEDVDTREPIISCPPTVESGGLTSTSLAPFHDVNN